MNVATEKQVQIIRPIAEYSTNARITFIFETSVFSLYE